MPADATDRRSVLAGTDWPIFTEQIFNEQYVPQRLQEALGACGLNAAEQRMIASGNALKLMGLA